MIENNFKRIEKKFWMSKDQFKELMSFLEDKMEAGEHGSYTVYNLYLDDDVYSLIRRSIKRPYFKEKIRVRSYGAPTKDSKVFLELKRKLDGIGYKRREKISYERALGLINQSVKPETQIECEIDDFIKRYLVKPKVILSYNRSPYRLKEDRTFRITFDSNLKYAMWNDYLDFSELNKPIMENPEDILLEIKTDKAIPLWFVNKLTELKIYQAPFSKIGAVYTKHIKGDNKC